MKYNLKPVVNSVTNTMEQLKASIRQMRQEYLAWRESLKDLTLAEVWAATGVREEVSPGGHPALVVGEGSTILCKNNISGLNALADLPKYRVLDWHTHIAWFDPSINCEAVRVEWVDDHFEVWDWKNGSFVRSVLSLPYSEIRSQRMRDMKQNLVNKHMALDELAQAKEFGNRFMVVMNDDLSKEHFLEEIKKYAESPYTEYQEARDARWQAAGLGRQLTRNADTRRRTSSVQYPEREKVIEALFATTNPVVVLATNPSGRPVRKVFDPADQKACDNLIAGIRAASPVVSFALEEIAE